MPLRPGPVAARAPALPHATGAATGGTLRGAALWAVALGLVSWAVLALLAARLPHGLAALRAAPWAVWPLSPASGVVLVLVAAIWARGVRATEAAALSQRPASPGVVSPGSVSPGRRAAFAFGLMAIFFALQSPIAALAPHSFALLAVVHLLLRSVAPLLFVLAEPWAVLGRGLGLREAALARIRARLGARLAWLIRPVPATALFVATAYLWQQPRWQDATLDSAAAQAALSLSLLASGLVFFAFLLDAPRSDARPFDVHPAPHGASLGAKLVMIWAAEVANILLGYFLTYSSLPIYPGFVRHGLIWGVTPLANQMYGGQTLWLCDTTMIGLAAMLVIYRWASHEDRTYRAPAGPAADPALRRARQRSGNRKVVFGLLGFVGIILGVMAATVGVYEVKYHSAEPKAGQVSVNQIPG